MYVLSHSVESDFRDPMNYSLPGSSVHGILQTGSHFLLQGIFPTQGLNPGLPHCSQILYHLSQQGSPKVGVTQCISLFLKLTHNPLNLVASQSWFRENEFKDYYAKTLTTKCFLTHKSSFDPINRGYKLPTIIIPTTLYSYFINGKGRDQHMPREQTEFLESETGLNIFLT